MGKIWSATGLISRTTVFSNLHKWFVWRNLIIGKAFCWWHITLSVQNKNNPISQHNNSLDKVCDSCYTYKMSCNPVSLRQAQRVVFSRKCAKEDNPLIDVYEYQSPRILFKLGCILMKNSITILTQKRSLVWFIKALASSETSPINVHGKLVF